MIDDRNLNQKYKEIQKIHTPDLWDRIESELQPIDRTEELSPKLSVHRVKESKNPAKLHRHYGWAAAAIFSLVVIGSWFRIPGSNMSEQAAATMAEVGDSATKELAAETTAAIVNGDLEAGQDTKAQGINETSEVILQYVSSLQVPDSAQTVPYNQEYFSEDILKETDLLFGAVITDVSFAYDDSGKAVHVVYKMKVSDVYYAEDYVAETNQLSVVSPIIETDGDEAYLLYQMQVGRHYLIPVKGQTGNWELLYPFAPQIQVLDGHSFIFHTGYKSLITGQTRVVEGIQEGENDFYYDRMVTREDNGFLSDLVSLMK